MSRDTGQEGSADTVAIQIQTCQHRIQRRRTFGLRNQSYGPYVKQTARQPPTFEPRQVIDRAYGQPVPPVVRLDAVGGGIIVIIVELHEPGIAG